MSELDKFMNYAEKEAKEINIRNFKHMLY